MTRAPSGSEADRGRAGAGSGSVGVGARGRGRELALAVLCGLEAHAGDSDEVRASARALMLSDPPQGEDDGERHFAALSRGDEVRAFAERLLDAWQARRAEIDAWIEQASQRWRLSRMAHVDRNVVRLAATELAALADTPRGVVLAEAVRLARAYGSDESARFVNGLVETLAVRLRPDAAGGSEVSGGDG